MPVAPPETDGCDDGNTDWKELFRENFGVGSIDWRLSWEENYRKAYELATGPNPPARPGSRRKMNEFISLLTGGAFQSAEDLARTTLTMDQNEFMAEIGRRKALSAKVKPS